MPSPESEVDRDDLLYDWWPLPDNEHANYWLRTAFDLIDSNVRLPKEIEEILEGLGVDVSEFTAWSEEHSDFVAYASEN